MTVPPRMFYGDWPDYLGMGTTPVDRHDGIGPRYVDELCESCGVRMQASGECRCS